MRPYLTLLILAGLLASSPSRADDPQRFPVLTKIPPASRQTIAGLMDWLRTLEDMPEAELRRRLGTPDEQGELVVNAATGRSARQLSWNLSRRSVMRFTITKGKVYTMSIYLMPSVNEAGPVN